MITQSAKIKMQNYSAKLKRILILSFGFALFTFSFALDCQALSNPQAKITETIRNYIYTKNPDWAGLKLTIELKYVNNLDRLLAGFPDKANFVIVDTYKSFRPVGNVIFPIKVSDQKVSKKIFVRAKVSVYDDVVVAQETISRREKIDQSKLLLEPRDIAMMPTGFYRKPTDLDGKEGGTSIPKGSTIYEWMVKKIPIARNGDSVAVVVKSENLAVRRNGVLLMDGNAGQIVKVRLPNAKDSLEGVLISPDLVEVTL